MNSAELTLKESLILELRNRMKKCEALCEYANHVFPCASLSGDGPCSCGYDAARAAVEGK